MESYSTANGKLREEVVQPSKSIVDNRPVDTFIHPFKHGRTKTKLRAKLIHTEPEHSLDPHLVDGANDVSSFVMRSTVPSNMDVPLDNRTLTDKCLPVSASHLVLYWKEVYGSLRHARAPDHVDLLHQ